MPFDATPEVKVDHPVVDTLKRAKAMISNPRHWCKDTESQVKNGVAQFCSIGAIMAANGWGMYSGLAIHARNALDRAVRRDYNYSGIIHFNDAHDVTHAQVMRLWDIAIADAEKEYNR